MRVKYENQKMRQSEIANQVGYSTSTSQRYRTTYICFHHTEFNQITLINNVKDPKY